MTIVWPLKTQIGVYGVRVTDANGFAILDAADEGISRYEEQVCFIQWVTNSLNATKRAEEEAEARG